MNYSDQEVAATPAPSGPRNGNGALAAPPRFELHPQPNLTQNQLRVWIAQTLVPNAPIYHLPSTLHIRGKIAPKHFQKAFQVLIDSSEALRTVMEEPDGIPTQRVLRELEYALEIADFSRLSDKLERAIAWMEDRSRIPLNWRERLFDSALVKLSDRKFIWYLNVHHLIGDGWSFELIYRHMADLYRLSLQGRLPKTIALLPYADYVVHERAHRQSSRYRKAEDYWKQKLAGDAGRISFYGKRPLTETTRVRRFSRDLGIDLTKRLAAAARAAAPGTEPASLPSIFAAVMAAYLHVIDGKQSYAIGIPFHNRRSKAFKETLGFFSEVLPVRIDIADDDTFASLARKATDESFKAARHGQHSIANSHFNKLYEVVVNYHTHSVRDFAGMTASPGWIHSGHGDSSLALHIHNFGASKSIVLDFELSEGMFNEQDSEQAVRHFLRVVEAFAADPHQPLRRLTLLSRKETLRIAAECSDAAAEPDRRLVHQTFAAQAALRPDGVAVFSPSADLSQGEERRLTYRELNRRANRLARFLQRRGVGPETLVGLYVERSLETIVGLLGILKAGGAYVPLDSKHSGEWLKFVLEDSRTPILLTQSALLATLPQDRPETICLDTEQELTDSAPAIHDDEEPPTHATKDHPAYVIYTSGTTGRPKGVEITHKALVNFAAGAAEIFALKTGDRVLQFASISFDTAVEEIFSCLMSGATLVLRTDSMLESPRTFLEQCRAWDITVLDLPTAYWHELTQSLGAERLDMADSVRLVVIGGERALPERLASWQARVGGRVRLLNTYGPTESTVTATVCDLTACYKRNDAFEEVPIGRPISNVEAHVLDRELRPVPVGVPGELHIGGMGLARGYRNLPRLTAETFVPHPFNKKSGSRLYRTGDLVRRRSDGNLEFLRRIDSQVKVRGFRVELEGIEAVLRNHPLVEQAVVAQDGATTFKPLIAGLVPRENAALNVDEIRAFAAKRLPEYMVPAVFVVLDALPLTPSGKIDRRALSVRIEARSEPARAYAPPRNSTEEHIARMWADVLRLERVGRDEHFFALGGHSLLATQLLSRMRREFGVDLPLRAIFEAPTVAGQAERVEEAKSRGKESDDAISSGVEPSPNGVPLSFSQTRIWFMDQVAPESAAYNIPAAIRFTGPLDKEALTRSLNELVRRHESLRTTFRNTVEGLVQVVTPELALEIPEIDLRPLAETARLGDAKRLLKKEASRPFDLEQGPLFRVLLVQLAEEDHVLLLNMHHGISDQWSLGIIAREVTAIYNAFRNALPAPAHPMPVPYSDFAISQGKYLTGDRRKAQLSYWRKQLADLQPLELPTDRPRPSVQTFHGAHAQFGLSKELVEGLKRLGVEENATLFMVFLAAFKALLRRYTGQEDIALGSPIANRNRTEWEGVVGTFINVLVLRTDLSGHPTFRELLRRTREVVLDAFAHQEMPFEKLVEELQPKRDTSRSPLVQVLFNFHNPPSGKVDMAGLSWAPFEIEAWASQFDLGVTIDSEITRKIWVGYNTDLYDAATIGRMLSQYARFLDGAVRNPDRPIAHIPIVTDSERHQLLREWNDTEEPRPQSCVHEIFEAQARRTPDAVAVVFPSTELPSGLSLRVEDGTGPSAGSRRSGEERLTYRELNRRAERVAGGLRAMGVGPEVRVGICMERSLDLLIGLLGILKAGGAYVPIDPAYPLDRIDFMVDDSGMRFLLTQENLATELRQIARRVVSIQELEKGTKLKKRKNRAGAAKPNHLAYAIYTSGSTGKPKGVQIEHRALANFLHSMRQKIGIGSRDTLLAVTTVCFDIAALELFLPLTVGARIVMASREVASDGKRLREELETSRATVMQATPATWRMLVDTGWKGSHGFKILCGGEALPADAAKALIERSLAVWNVYGPTETTVWSTAWQVDPDYGRISIGKPIANTQIYILDRNLAPVLIGVAGELHIAGDGVARGYLNRPELTAEKFIPHPWSDQAGARLYKTGDLARYRPDGNIELLGRLDHQVKVRGFRIELGEIEAVLSRYPAVHETVVVAREDPSTALRTGKRLVAYVVSNQEPAPTVSELRAFLKGKLPEYMVPAAFVMLDALPLTPNGKVDRKVLPEPDQSRPEQEVPFLPPSTPVEKAIAEIWAQVLKVDKVGIHDNFFDLGGHSLLATQVVSRLRELFSVELPLRSFFVAPTVRGLAGLIEKSLESDAESPAPKISPVSRQLHRAILPEQPHR